MTFPKARLVVAACLFFGWIGFLLFLVVESRKVVLSRPQFLVAQAYVVVDVRDHAGSADAEVTVDRVLWSSNQVRAPQRQLDLPMMSLLKPAHGYRGAGKYLLPLIVNGDSWTIAPLPGFFNYRAPQPTHGVIEIDGVFSHRLRLLPIAEAQVLRKKWVDAGFRVDFKEEELRVYPWTPDTEAQVNVLIQAKQT